MYTHPREVPEDGESGSGLALQNTHDANGGFSWKGGGWALATQRARCNCARVLKRSVLFTPGWFGVRGGGFWRFRNSGASCFGGSVRGTCKVAMGDLTTVASLASVASLSASTPNTQTGHHQTSRGPREPPEPLDPFSRPNPRHRKLHKNAICGGLVCGRGQWRVRGTS